MRQTCSNTVEPSPVRCSVPDGAPLASADQLGEMPLALDQRQVAQVGAGQRTAMHILPPLSAISPRMSTDVAINVCGLARPTDAFGPLAGVSYRPSANAPAPGF